jgi:hypothetical protein
MHIDKVSYTKTFNLGNYSSEKIGVELELHQGESATKALDIARALVMEYHLKNNPELIPVDSDVEEIQVSPEDKKEAIIKSINDCTSEGELRSFYMMCQKDAVLKSAYDLKVLTLKNK